MAEGEMCRLGYADPPYIGCAGLYRDQPDYAGEVDHAALIDRLQSEFDGWVLHAAATPRSYAVIIPIIEKIEGVRVCQWLKGFAPFKRNVPVGYASEPVFIKAARKPVVSKRHISRDWIETPSTKASCTLKRGLTGAKPEKVCHWAFELLGARPEDELADLFPGTGAVTKAWRTWRLMFALPAAAQMRLEGKNRAANQFLARGGEPEISVSRPVTLGQQLTHERGVN